MNADVMEVVASVLTNMDVIIAAVAVVLYLNFVVYVVRYRKRPPRPRQKKRIAAAPAQKESPEEEIE